MTTDKVNIAILTDFGLDDIYLGLMKAVILKVNPDANIIDISHAVESYNIKQAAFIISKVVNYFPQNTVFLCVVDPGVGSERRPLIIHTDKYYFVGPDNGLFSYILNNNKSAKAIEITNNDYFLKDCSSTFHGRDVFAPVAAHLSLNDDVEIFGKLISNSLLKRIDEPKFNINFLDNDELEIVGEVLYSDKYGNLISSIEYDKIKNLKIKKIIVENFETSCILKNYTNVEIGKFLCYVGSLGNIEFALRNGNLKEKLSTSFDSNVKFYFTK